MHINIILRLKFTSNCIRCFIFSDESTLGSINQKLQIPLLNSSALRLFHITTGNKIWKSFELLKL